MPTRSLPNIALALLVALATLLHIPCGQAESQTAGSILGTTRRLPLLANYGTSVLALHKYMGDLGDTPLEVCREAASLHQHDGIYCLSLRSSGDEAWALIRKGAQAGNAVAMNNLAMRLSVMKKPEHSEEIRRLMRAAATYGIPHAQVTVGWWSMTGEHGFPVDYAEAMKWNHRAYAQGHSEGANNIGELYEKGWGVIRSAYLARMWYREAMDMGNKEAAERLMLADD